MCVCMSSASQGSKLNYPQKCQSANGRAIPPYSPTERPIVLGIQGTHSCGQPRSRKHPIHDWLKPVPTRTHACTHSCEQPRSRKHPIHDWLKPVPTCTHACTHSCEQPRSRKHPMHDSSNSTSYVAYSSSTHTNVHICIYTYVHIRTVLGNTTEQMKGASNTSLNDWKPWQCSNQYTLVMFREKIRESLPWTKPEYPFKLVLTYQRIHSSPTPNSAGKPLLHSP